jgi:hypothetical protein
MCTLLFVVTIFIWCFKMCLCVTDFVQNLEQCRTDARFSSNLLEWFLKASSTFKFRIKNVTNGLFDCFYERFIGYLQHF